MLISANIFIVLHRNCRFLGAFQSIKRKKYIKFDYQIYNNAREVIATHILNLLWLERIQNGKDEKIEKLLDKILPLLVILRMCDEMINKIHANISRDNTIKGISKSFPSELDQYLSSKYDYVIYYFLF